ncbi:SDR family NAD(P)-dependent oxidoreductase [Zobellia nedashkovskayae]
MNDLFDLRDKTIALSGGTGVLGGSIAEYLVKNGASVILLGRSADKLDEKRNVLNRISMNSAFSYVVDVMEEKELVSLREQIKEAHGAIDGLINLAGGNLPGATLRPDQTVFDISLEDTKQVVDLNLFGSVLPTIVLSQLMAEQGHGSIINISSMASKQSITRVLGYSMAKAGIDIFTKWMAEELATKFSDNIRVNAIAPGFFIGNQNRKILINEDGSHTERSKKNTSKNTYESFWGRLRVKRDGTLPFK